MIESLPHECPVRESLAQQAESWGGQLLRVTEEKFSTMKLERAPFTDYLLGIDWDHKLVIYAEDVPWTDIIHEMGHVFACPDHPREFPSEWNFLGWEVVVAKNYDIDQWIKSNDDYMLGDHRGLMATQPRKELDVLLTERVLFAQGNGLLDSNGNPLSIR